MRIKQAAQASGLTERAIRFYEQVGLISPAKSANQFRQYSETDILRLRLIAHLRRLDFPLDQIGGLLDRPDQLEEALRSAARQKSAAAADQRQVAEQIEAVLAGAGGAGAGGAGAGASAGAGGAGATVGGVGVTVGGAGASGVAQWVARLDAMNQGSSLGAAARSDSPDPDGLAPKPGRQPVQRRGGFAMIRSEWSNTLRLLGRAVLVIAALSWLVSLFLAIRETYSWFWTIILWLVALPVAMVPGMLCLGLAEALNNQKVLDQQHRTLLNHVDLALEGSVEYETSAGASESAATYLKTWQCPQCKTSNESSSLFCKGCSSLRDMGRNS